MASARGLRAGKAVIELALNGNDKVQAALRNVQRRASAIGQSLTRVGGGMLGMGAAIGGAFISPIRAAGDLQETLSKFSAVFGDQAESAGDFADELAARVGRSSAAIRDSMSSTQAMFVGMGIDPAKAREMSQQLAEMGLDMASFHNLSDEEASSRLLSALGGSTEVLEKFGVNLKAAAMDQKLLEMGISKTNSQASEQEKLFARVAIIAESLGAQGALGDATTTAGSFSNQMKRLKSTMADIMATIGGSVLPTVTKFMGVINQGAGFLAAFAESNGHVFRTVAMMGLAIAAAGAAFVTLGLSFSLIGVAIGGFMSAVSAIGAVLSAIISPIGVLVAGLAALVTWFATSTSHGRAMVANLSAWFGQLATTAKRIFGSITDALAMGDIALAGEVAMAALHVAWLEGTEKIHNAWLDFKDLFLRTTTELIFSAQEKFAELAATIKKLLVDIKTLQKQAGERIGHYFTRTDEHSDQASKDTIAHYEREGDQRKTGIDDGLQSRLDRIDENRKTAQEDRDRIANKEKRAAEALRDAAKERLRAAEKEVAQRKLELEQQAAAQVDPDVAPAVAAAMATAAGQVRTGGMFDTRFARQMLVGPQDQQVQLLGKIERNTRRRSAFPNGLGVA